MAVGQKPNTAVSYFDPNQLAPTSYQSNLSLQRELGADLVVEVGYVGNISRHLTANDFTLDQVPANLMGPGNTQALRPFPQFSNVTLINPSIGKSSYVAGFLRVQKRFSDGFSLLAHYTRSRFMDDASRRNTGHRQPHGRLLAISTGRPARATSCTICVSVLYEASSQNHT